MMTDREYATPFSMLHAASLLGQRSRLKKFKEAIDSVVKNGDYVVDIGTGSGVLAILAAKAGAGRVTAIEINPESIKYAKEAASLNGVEHLIEFYEGNYSEFLPEEKADVVICEMLSSMMLVEQQIPASLHATKNILKPDGSILPQMVSIYLVPVESYEVWDRFHFSGLQFPRVVQTATPEATRDLSDMQVLERFDLGFLDNNIAVDKTLDFSILSKGTLHGFVGVFESKLCEDVHLNMEDGWKQLFIPIPDPIDVVVGDVVSVRIKYQPGKYDSLTIEIS